MSIPSSPDSSVDDQQYPTPNSFNGEQLFLQQSLPNGGYTTYYGSPHWTHDGSLDPHSQNVSPVTENFQGLSIASPQVPHATPAIVTAPDPSVNPSRKARVNYVKKKKDRFDELRTVLHKTTGTYPVHQPQVLNDATQTILNLKARVEILEEFLSSLSIPLP